jgi:hypothetical protein
MVIDYKHVAFSFEDQKRKRRLKKLKIIAMVVVFLLAVFLFQYLQQDKKIKKIQDLLLNDRWAEAAELFKILKNSILHSQTIKELNALIILFSGDMKNARLILNSLEKPKTSISARSFLNHFAERSKYDELKIYTDYLINKQESVRFYKALYLTAFFKYGESEKQLDRISPGQRKSLTRAIDLVSNLNSKLKSGKVDYIFDKNGKPLAHYDLKARKTVSVTPGMHFDEFTPRFEKGIKTYTLSLDLNIQNKIDRVFKKYRGSMILFKIEDSGILAAFSKPRQSMKSNTVFTAEFEPGSIIKTLTLFAFYLNPQKDLFPFDCRRSIRLSNRNFPDRIAHGIIENPHYALVVSCNIAFARMGIAVGFKSLSRVLDSFFFNSKGFRDQFFTFKTGNYNLNISGDYQLANLAVGLNDITSTTFHSGLMALIIAQNGSINKPYLIINKKNILNLGFYNHQPEIVSVFDNNPIFFKISQAMVEVVENRLGTGRHSKVQFVKTAIKTGTAGQKKQGLNSIIIGFFPAAKPEYAFAFILKGAGKAELNGAYLLKEFLGLFYEQP